MNLMAKSCCSVACVISRVVVVMLVVVDVVVAGDGFCDSNLPGAINELASPKTDCSALCQFWHFSYHPSEMLQLMMMVQLQHAAGQLTKFQIHFVLRHFVNLIF